MMGKGWRSEVGGRRSEDCTKETEVEMLGSSEGESSQARNVAIMNYEFLIFN